MIKKSNFLLGIDVTIEQKEVKLLLNDCVYLVQVIYHVTQMLMDLLFIHLL